MEDKGWIVFIPLSWILIAVFSVLLTGAGMIYQIEKWFLNNMQTIIIVSIVVCVINAVILSIVRKDVIRGFCSLFPASQFVFFMIKGGIDLPTGNGLKLIWSMILFILYAVYGVINLFIVLITWVYSYLPEKENEESLWAYADFGVCGAGWIINFLIFVVF